MLIHPAATEGEMDRPGSTLEDVAASKAVLRKEIRARLRATTDTDRATQSEAIRARVIQLDAFREAKIVVLYKPLPREVDVTPLWREAARRGCRTYFPRLEEGDLLLRFVRVERDDDWCTTMRPFPMPRADLVSLTESEATVAVCIIPGLAFAADGSRLGRGRGYYDRALVAPPFSGRAYRVGVAFAEQLVERVPTDSQDVRMDAVVTPGKTWLSGLPLGAAT